MARHPIQASDRPSGLVGSAIYGAIIALVLAFALAYLVTACGVGDLTSPGKAAPAGKGILLRTGLNLYAMHHITLDGSGVVSSPIGSSRVSASVIVPLTVWTAIPVIALIIAGYLVGKSRRGVGKLGVAASAILCGILYAAALTALSTLFRARLDPSLFPAFGRVEFNPPPVPFHPSTQGAIVFGLIFGVVFANLGSLIALRGMRGERRRGKWWACAKAAVLPALLIQAILCGAAVWWIITSPRTEELDSTAGMQALVMTPTVAGLGYAVLHGASLNASIEPPIYPSMGFNLYTGATTSDQPDTSRTLERTYLYIAGGILAIVALLAGWLAVRWGSRDGSIPTAFRFAAMHTLYLALIMALCEIGWSEMRTGGGLTSRSSILAQARFDMPVAYTVLGLTVFSFLGAFLANMKYQRRGGYPGR